MMKFKILVPILGGIVLLLFAIYFLAGLYWLIGSGIVVFITLLIGTFILKKIIKNNF